MVALSFPYVAPSLSFLYVAPSLTLSCPYVGPIFPMLALSWPYVAPSCRQICPVNRTFFPFRDPPRTSRSVPLCWPYLAPVLALSAYLAPMLALSSPYVNPILTLCCPIMSTNLSEPCANTFNVAPSLSFLYVAPSLTLCWPIWLCWPYVGLSWPYLASMLTPSCPNLAQSWP